MKPRTLHSSEAWTVQSIKTKESKSSKAINKRENWLKHWIVEALEGYCRSTGLHGFNYITRPETSHGEKIFWIIIVLIAMIVSIILLVISWNWNAESPTVTVIESTHFATWNVPFPAVTVCSFNKVSRSKAYRYAEALTRPKNVSVDELARLFLSVMDFAEISQRNSQDYLKLGTILDDNGVNTINLQTSLSPDCTDLISRCMWKGTQTRCDTLFQTVNSTAGICCSFNYHATRTNNYPPKLAHTIPKLPRRVTASGHQTGLTAIIDPASDDYFGTYLSGYGFRVFIHDSYDYPGPNGEIKIVSTKTENFISITPESTYATDDVRQLSVHKRGCLFQNQQPMSSLKYYSYVNCLTECRSNLYLKLCGCIPPGMLNNGSYAVCKMQDMPCVLRNMNFINAALPGSNETLLEEQGIFHSACDCLSDCELNQYFAEIATGILNRKHSFNAMNLFKDLEITNHIVIHAYFNDLISTRYRKDIFQNWISLLASSGGLLGLIIGFSIVTAFEFIYYLTLRPIFAYLSLHAAKRQSKIHVEEFDKSDKTWESKK